VIATAASLVASAAAVVSSAATLVATAAAVALHTGLGLFLLSLCMNKNVYSFM
jgi:hypothetical protein